MRLFLVAIIILIIIIVIYLCYRYIIKNNNHKIIATNIQPQYQPGYAKITDPYIKPYIIHRLLSPEEAKLIIERCKDKLFDSEVIGGKHKNIRNSQQTWISKNDPLVKPLVEKLSEAFHIPFENAEDLQVVRYQPGQYYHEHHDSCCDDNPKCFEFYNRGGQRKLTVLIYLNGDFEGGPTYFKNMNLKVKPDPGDALVFYPLAEESRQCHPLALHAGTAVHKGEKWVANLWFRENKFV